MESWFIENIILIIIMYSFPTPVNNYPQNELTSAVFLWPGSTAYYAWQYTEYNDMDILNVLLYILYNLHKPTKKSLIKKSLLENLYVVHYIWLFDREMAQNTDPCGNNQDSKDMCYHCIHFMAECKKSTLIHMKMLCLISIQYGFEC